MHDPIAAFAFYTEVLGFVGRMYVPEACLAVVSSPEEPNGVGLLLQPRDNPIGKAHQEAVYNAGLPIIVIDVDDIHKEYERLLGLGVVFRSEPTRRDWGTQAVFEDTCGNLVQLHQV